MAAADTAVDRLDRALARARRAGADVQPVHRTGEVRVIWRGRRVTVNARRKDSTRELADLVEAAEAAAPERTTRPLAVIPVEQMVAFDDPGQRPIQPATSTAARIRNYLRDQPADADGWIAYDSAAIRDLLGTAPNAVAFWTSDAMRRGEIEVHRKNPSQPKSGAIDAIRFLRDHSVGKAEAAERRDYRDQPLRPVDDGGTWYTAVTCPIPGCVLTATHRHTPADFAAVPRDPIPAPDVDLPAAALGALETPALARYADAYRKARAHEWLAVQMPDDQLRDVLRDAVRLYFWHRAGGKDR